MKNKQGHMILRKMITGLAAFALGVSVTGLSTSNQASAADPTPIKVVGSFLTCQTEASSDCYLQTSDGGSTYSGTFTVPKGEYYFYISDNGSKVGATRSDDPDASDPTESDGAVNVPYHMSSRALESYFYAGADGTDVTFTYNTNTHRYSVNSGSDPVYTILGDMQGDVDKALPDYLQEACDHAIQYDTTGGTDAEFPDSAGWRPACMNMMLKEVGDNLWVWGDTGIGAGPHQLKIVEGLSWYSNWGVNQYNEILGKDSTFRGKAGNNIRIDQPTIDTPSSNPTSQKQYTEIVFGPTTDNVTCPGLNTPIRLNSCPDPASVRPTYGTVVNTFTAYDDAMLATKMNKLPANGTSSYTLTVSAEELADTLGSSTLIKELTVDNIVLTNPYGDDLTISDWTRTVQTKNGRDWTYFEATVTSLIPNLYNLQIAIAGIDSSPEAPVTVYSPALRFVGTYSAHLETDPDPDSNDNFNPVNGQNPNKVKVTATDDTVTSTIMNNRDVALTVSPSDVTVSTSTANTGATGEASIDVRSNDTTSEVDRTYTFEGLPVLTDDEQARNQACLDFDGVPCFILKSDTATTTFTPRIPEYKVTYWANNDPADGVEESVEDADGPYREGDEVTVRSNTFTKDHATFVGWSTTRDGEVVHTPGDEATGTFVMPGQDVDLYAVWEPEGTYQLRYHAEGGSPQPAAQTGYYAGDQADVSSTKPARTGYEFQGWEDRDLKVTYQPAGSVPIVDKNVDVYALWDPILSYDLNGGQGKTPGSASHPKDSSVTVAAEGGDFAKSDVDGRTMVFTGWNTQADGKGTAYAAESTLKMPGAPTTLWAQWERLLTLTYWANDGTQTNTYGGEHASGTDASVDQNSFTRTGYEFVGWNTVAARPGNDQDLVQPASKLTFVDADIDLYAQWNPLLSYSLNGGQGTPPLSAYHKAGSTVTVAPEGEDFTMTVDGRTWVFKNWNTKADGSGTTYAAAGALTMPDAPTTLYAQWEPLYKLTYWANDGTQTNRGGGEHKSDTSVTVGQNSFTRSGYEFTGWNTLADRLATGAKEYLPASSLTILNKDVDLYAQWNPLLSYDLNGGQGTTPPSAYHQAGSDVTVAAEGDDFTMTVDGRTYVFDTWSTTLSGAGTSYDPASTLKMPDRPTTLYARWLPLYVLDYNAGDGGVGTVPEGGVYLEGTDVTVASPDKLSKPNHTFGGWVDTSGSAFVAGDTLTMPGHDETLTALWIPDAKYPVSYNANGGSGPVPQTVSYYAGDGVTVSARSTELVRTHFTFDSWNTKADGTGTKYDAGNTFNMPAAAVILYAQWTPDPTYTLSYDTQGGSPATIPAQPGYHAGDQAVVSSTAPTKVGYSFAGWKDLVANASYQPSGNVPIIDKDVTLTAQWTPLPGAISLDKQASRDVVNAQDQVIAYTFTVKNTGPVALEHVTLVDPMLTNENCPATTLAIGASMECSGSYKVTQADLNKGTPLLNTATATGNPTNGQPQVSSTASAAVQVSRTPGLKVTKGVDVTEAEVGDKLTYTVTIKNTGNTTLQYTYTDTYNGKGAWDKKFAKCVDADSSEQLSLSVESAVLAPGQTVVCTMTPYTVVEADLAVGELFNVILVTGTTVDGPDDPVDDPAESPKTKLIPPIQVPTGGMVVGSAPSVAAMLLAAAGVALAGGWSTRRAVSAKR